MELTDTSTAKRYRFGPRNHRGTLGGLRWEQSTLIALILVVCVIILRSTVGRSRLYEAFLLLATGLASALWPIRDRTLQQWIPVVGTFVANGAARGRRAVSRGGSPQSDWLAARSFVELVPHEISRDSGELGVIGDPRRHTLSAVLRLRGDSFVLLDSSSRQRVTDGWSGVLLAIAQQLGSLFRLSLLERTVPDNAIRAGEGAVTAFAARPDGALVGARRSYLSLLDQEAAGVLRHECHLVVTVRAGGLGSPAAPSALMRTLDEIATRCAEVGIATEGALSPSGLRTFLARGFAAGAVLSSGGGGLPLAFSEQWASLRADGTWHATYWVAEWPRVDVGADFLMPFLLEPGFRRSSAVVMQPRGVTGAVRAAERARTEKAADLDLRRRHGFAQSARSLREQDAVLRRESELAAGHGAFRFSGYVSVTASSLDRLERDCARAEQAAARSHLVLRRLYGTQRLAATFVLPLGRGL